MHDDSATAPRKPMGRSPQPGDIAAQALYRKVAGLLDRLLLQGEPEADLSDKVAGSLRIPRAEAERLCNLHMMTICRQHRTLRMGVEWALRESGELGGQMFQEFREDRAS